MDIVRVVKESSTYGKNKAQLTVSPSEFFKNIPSITTYHHFKVSKSETRMMTVEEYVDSLEEKVNIFKKDVNELSLRDQQRSLLMDWMRSGSGT